MYFNSPSVPSFRLFDDEDDLGNFIEDPKLRRPIGTVSGTSCPVDRAKSMLESLVSKVVHGEVDSLVHVL